FRAEGGIRDRNVTGVQTCALPMYGEDDRLQEVFYYITVYNEPMVQPAEPEDLDVDGLLKGMYVLEAAPEGEGPEAQLLASGVGVPWAKTARERPEEDWGRRAPASSV